MQSTHFDNGRQITVYHNDSILTFNREDNEDLFLKVRELYKVADYDGIANLTVSIENINFRYLDSDLNINKEGVVTINGDVLPSSLSKVIVALYKEDAPIDCFINFWHKLNENPFATTVARLYDFIEKNGITILPDGDLLLYRVVKRTQEPGVFVDLYTSTIKQAIGDTLSLPYNKVDNRNDILCSFGYHAACFSYMSMYGNAYSGQDAVVNVRVNPKDICAVPYDNIGKIRTREFTILEENTNLTEIRQTYYNNQLESSCDEDYEENDWDDDSEESDEDY
jgi:hypothetical protein